MSFFPSVHPSVCLCVCRTPYLRNSIVYHHDFCSTCVKWWYLQAFIFKFWFLFLSVFFFCFFFIFSKFWFARLRGGGVDKKWSKITRNSVCHIPYPGYELVFFGGLSLFEILREGSFLYGGLYLLIFSQTIRLIFSLWSLLTCSVHGTESVNKVFSPRIFINI